MALQFLLNSRCDRLDCKSGISFKTKLIDMVNRKKRKSHENRLKDAMLGALSIPLTCDYQGRRIGSLSFHPKRGLYL
ncbi:hypothetical protein G9A89_003224 [Geosiphon pyriformis]|nr:hypothetical protein G9A89_003224 [Geosiphon pyriformis]